MLMHLILASSSIIYYVRKLTNLDKKYFWTSFVIKQTSILNRFKGKVIMPKAKQT